MRAVRHFVVSWVMVGMAASAADAQLVQNTRESERLELRAQGTDESQASQVEPLAQVAIQATSEGATARVQGLKLFLQEHSDRWSFLVNSQLPLHGTDRNNSDEAAASKPEPGQYLTAQLADEHGGLLNMSLGYSGRVWTMENRPARPKANSYRPGLLLDARAGLKLIELPEQPDDAPALLAAVSPFWSGTVSLLYELPLYDGNGQHAAGLRFGITAAGSYASDADFQTVFSTPLDRAIGHVRGHLFFTLPGLGELELSGLMRSSDPFASKRMTVAFHAFRK